MVGPARLALIPKAGHGFMKTNELTCRWRSVSAAVSRPGEGTRPGPPPKQWDEVEAKSLTMASRRKFQAAAEKKMEDWETLGPTYVRAEVWRQIASWFSGVSWKTFLGLKDNFMPLMARISPRTLDKVVLGRAPPGLPLMR